ncbi:superfamily I DNA and RNA helicase [Anaerolinea thermolimosa]|nr:ATP-dependent helicase [Anaerolinea thermolimosa]GAP07633.1 superfamily I DNA and RNA helicase [Anaerolinea thermolimosa]
MAEKRQLRSSQSKILTYRSGWMGISAVPGAGKTYTLSRLAADILLRGEIAPDQEILIVTLVNSAVDNFSARIATFLQEANVLPGMGYTVRTLHGLAHDIVRQRPEAVGLAEDFSIIDESEATRILEEIAAAWMRSNFHLITGYLSPDLSEQKLEDVRRNNLPRLVQNIGLQTIRYAKDQELSPEALRLELDRLPMPLPLAEMGWAIYADYQRALRYRGAVDFDDLIRLALLALKLDPALVKRLRYQWPYILEDEAQDSSRLQEEILRHLAGAEGNWVRVGDPNQAIYETFTTASPDYLINFRRTPGVISRELHESGRSTLSIIRLANHLIEWSNRLPPEDLLSKGLAYPLIRPTSPDDPRPNPPDQPEKITLHSQAFSPAEELQKVAKSIARWLQEPENQGRTVAVLSSNNKRGFDMVDELRRQGVDVVDSLLRSTQATRAAASALSDLLNWLAEPDSPSLLSKAYQAWRTRGDLSKEEKMQIPRVARQLQALRRVEDFLAPQPGSGWPQESLAREDPGLYAELIRFRDLLQRWQSAATLPPDQLTLTLAQDLFTEPSDLAVAHKLSSLIRQSASIHPDWHIKQFSAEVAVIARNQRRFIGFSDEDTRFDPDRYPGKVVVATIHKAKGLEWDRVYLLAANNYDFPSNEYDPYIAEWWYLRDQLNLEAEALAQLKAALSKNEYDFYQEGEASRQDRREYVRERLRLLFVGITRARRELVITWNTGRNGNLTPARAFQELIAFWNKSHG